ncbi:MAG TPA: hypothetical protein VGO80_09890 [Solirubrobacteraceae bacterium]|nr:hypothetical protein [Solirubrobacteraceae bacterium]
MIAQQMRVAVARALLQAAADLAYEAVDIDHQPAVTRAGAGLPGALDRPAQQRIELTDVPERKRAQERPQRRRRRNPATEQPARAPCPQHAGVINAVGAQDHRVDERHHLAPRIRRARPVATQPHQIARQRLDPQPQRKRRDHHDPGVADNPLVVELDLYAIRSDRLVILHHEGDLLPLGPGCRYSLEKPCTEGHSSFWTGRTPPTRSVDWG